MKNCILITLLALQNFTSVAQFGNRQFGNKEDQKREEQFTYIESKFDYTYLKYIRTFQCNSKEGDDISSMLRAIRIQAVPLGANCFRLKNFTRIDSTGQMTLILETYFATDIQLELNSALHETNVMYIFSDHNFGGRIHTFKLNDSIISLPAGYYYKYYLKYGEEASLNMGGHFGSTLTIRWIENKPPLFIKVSGAGLADVYGVNQNKVIFGLTGGKLYYLTTNLGLLLANTLQLLK